jgi:hypothetical protein
VGEFHEAITLAGSFLELVPEHLGRTRAATVAEQREAGRGGG